MIAIAIDDEPIALEVIKSHAAKVPFVELKATFTNAFDAIDFLQKNKTDLLFLDIKMPEVNGFELCQKIKEIDSNVKTCFLTASELFYDEYRRLEAYPRVNKEHFIQKPIRNEELIRKLNGILYPIRSNL